MQPPVETERQRQPLQQHSFPKPILIVSSPNNDQQVDVIGAVGETSSISTFKSTSLIQEASSSEKAVVPFRRREDVPYIRPTKFIPVLDYFSSSEKASKEAESKWQEQKHDSLSTWRKVTYEVPQNTKRRRDSLTTLVDKSMQDMNKQFKANISQLSQGICYNRMERKVESDLGGVSGVSSTQVKDKPKEDSKEDTNPLIYFKYDFGYEFGIANPRNVRASSEPPTKKSLPSSSTDRPVSWMPAGDNDAPIILPIIHETSSTTTTKHHP